ncbi:MAG: hypothetical protein ABIV25_02985 [Paracoccaceae bacterium]
MTDEPAIHQRGPAQVALVSTDAAGDKRRCPFCREEIYADALKCRFCSSALVPIAENFRTVGPKFDSYVIYPDPNHSTMLGHGWAGLLLSVLALGTMGTFVGDGKTSAAVTLAVVAGLVLFPWMLRLLQKPEANKILPALALIVTTLVMFAALGIAVKH